MGKRSTTMTGIALIYLTAIGGLAALVALLRPTAQQPQPVRVERRPRHVPEPDQE